MASFPCAGWHMNPTEQLGHPLRVGAERKNAASGAGVRQGGGIQRQSGGGGDVGQPEAASVGSGRGGGGGQGGGVLAVVANVRKGRRRVGGGSERGKRRGELRACGGFAVGGAVARVQ